MTPSERAELKRIVNTLFENGPNKADTVDAIEVFIDRNYIYKHGPIRQLMDSIDRAGSYAKWRIDLKNDIKQDLRKAFT